MCGRFTQLISWQDLHDLYELVYFPDLDSTPARYNGAPTQDFAVCRLNNDGNRSGTMLRWGLVPFWAEDTKIGSRLINARAETIHSKPSFRSAFRSRRCLVPVNNWFEWRSTGGRKQPWLIRSEEESILTLAGLWESWSKEGDTIETFTLITTQASPELSDVHHRQPAIIAPSDFEQWLDVSTKQDQLKELVLRPRVSGFITHPVSLEVNNVRNNGPQVIEPLRELQ